VEKILLRMMAVAFIFGCAALATAAPPPPEDKVTVEVAVAAVHVSKDLKAGVKVDLEQVTAKTGAGTFVDYKTKKVLGDLEVASVTKLEKPSNPDEAVKVELKVTKEQAKLIENLKSQMSPYEERSAGKPANVITKPSVLRVEEISKIEVAFAAKNVPEELKVGSKVRLVRLTGRTIIPTGQVSETKSPVVPGLLEVLKVEKVENPTDPEQAVKVEFKVTKNQAERIERAKAQQVTVVERAGGKPVTKKMPIPMIIELSKDDEKK
jgi:hypothetical protein